MGGRSNSASSNPSYGNQIRINPSAVPTEKGVGIEGILYQNDVDLALVKGLGRVGAAISPANSEETFFGPPGIELTEDYLTRKQEAEKYPSQKFTFATAFDLLKRRNSGLKSQSLQLGLMGKYNKYTHNISPGGGLSGVVGFFTFGGSLYNDETALDAPAALVDPMDPLNPTAESSEKIVTTYQVQTYNLGVSLGSFLLDYSVLHMETTDTHEVSTVRIATGSLLVKKLIFTFSKRIEDSARPKYNFSTQQLEEQMVKEDYFGGIQANLTHNFLMGLLYNYYLLHEYSITATFFF
jgi:hypothetical protein